MLGSLPAPQQSKTLRQESRPVPGTLDSPNFLLSDRLIPVNRRCFKVLLGAIVFVMAIHMQRGISDRTIEMMITWTFSPFVFFRLISDYSKALLSMINERQIAWSVAFSVWASYKFWERGSKWKRFLSLVKIRALDWLLFVWEIFLAIWRRTYQPESQISQALLRNHNGRILSASPRPTRRNESVVE